MSTTRSTCEQLTDPVEAVVFTVTHQKSPKNATGPAQPVPRLGSRAHGNVPIARGLLAPDDAPAAASTAGAAWSARADAVREEVVIAHREQPALPRRSAIGAAPLAGRRSEALAGPGRRAQRRPGGCPRLRLRLRRRLRLLLGRPLLLLLRL